MSSRDHLDGVEPDEGCAKCGARGGALLEGTEVDLEGSVGAGGRVGQWLPCVRGMWKYRWADTWVVGGSNVEGVWLRR